MSSLLKRSFYRHSLACSTVLCFVSVNQIVGSCDSIRWARLITLQKNASISCENAVAANDGAENNGVENNGVENNGVENDGVEDDGVENDGVSRRGHGGPLE